MSKGTAYLSSYTHKIQEVQRKAETVNPVPVLVEHKQTSEKIQVLLISSTNIILC